GRFRTPQPSAQEQVATGDEQGVDETGVDRDADPRRFRTAGGGPLARELLPSGHSCRRGGPGIRHDDGEGPLNPDPWPAPKARKPHSRMDSTKWPHPHDQLGRIAVSLPIETHPIEWRLWILVRSKAVTRNSCEGGVCGRG